MAGTCCRVDGPLDQVVVLVNPLAVALEVDLRGWSGAAGQRHRLVLHDVLIFRLHLEVRQQVGEGGGKGGGGCVLGTFREGRRNRDFRGMQIKKKPLLTDCFQQC